MYSQYDRRPAWFRDAKWTCAVLLSICIAVGTVLFSMAQVTRPELSSRVLESLLSLSLLDQDPVLSDLETAETETAGVEAADAAEAETDDGATELTVRQGLAYSPGDVLPLLPGVSVTAGASEVETISPAAARERIANLLADDIISGGLGAALERVSDPVLRTQLEQSAQNTLPILTRALLEETLMPAPAELGTGTRLTDWPLQEQQRPNQDVQPIVGVFVNADPDLLRTLSPREIGAYVVNQLGLITLNEGLTAAQEVVSRETILTLLTSTVNEDVRRELGDYFSTLLLPQDTLIAQRLQQARDIITLANTPPEEAEEAGEAAGLNGITLASDLVGLTREEANRRIVRDLSAAVYARGVGEVLPQMNDETQRAKVARVSGLLNLFTRDSHRGLVRNSYLLGAGALLLLIGFLYFSSGWERLVGSGFVAILGAGAGALVFALLFRNPAAVTLPVAPDAVGVPAYTFDALRYGLASLPGEALELFIRNHLIVLATGAGLLLLYLIMQLLRVVRPQRRRLL